MNKLFFIAAMRTRRELSLSFEVEITAFSFDHKRMELRIVNNEDRPKAIGAGLQPDEYGYVSIDCKHDFTNDDVIYSIVDDI